MKGQMLIQSPGTLPQPQQWSRMPEDDWNIFYSSLYTEYTQFGGFICLRMSPFNLSRAPLTSRKTPKAKSKTLTRWVKGEDYKEHLQKAKIEFVASGGGSVIDYLLHAE